MAKAKAHSTNTISPVLQKLFVGAAGLMFGMQIVQNVYYMLQQLPNNDNFSAYYVWFLGTFVIMSIWLVIYLSRRNRKPSLTTLFEVTLTTVSVSMITMGIGWLTSYIQLPLVSSKMLDGFSLYYAFDIALPVMITIPLLVVVIRRLRAARQW
jgi:cobalamin synthase